MNTAVTLDNGVDKEEMNCKNGKVKIGENSSNDNFNCVNNIVTADKISSTSLQQR